MSGHTSSPAPVFDWITAGKHVYTTSPGHRFHYPLAAREIDAAVSATTGCSSPATSRGRLHGETPASPKRPAGELGELVFIGHVRPLYD